MEYVIKNEYLKAVISSFGGELRELIDNDGMNRMHIPNSDTWNRVSPILFPQISRMPNSEYSVHNQIYKMTTHGFIRDKELELVTLTSDEIVFMYKSNEETLLMYPYEFVFYVGYKLNKNILEVNFKVENPSNDVLRYMLGGHPAFKVPLFAYESFEDYIVLFENAECAKRMLVVGGYLSNKHEDYLIENRVIELKHCLFKDDALIFKNLKSTYVELASRNHDKKIRFYFSDFEILAIWSKVEEKVNLLCFEPWNGIPQEFVKEHERMCVLEINPHDFASFTYKIEVI